jgi:hypothetical protein
MDQIHLIPLVDQIQLALGHIFNKTFIRKQVLQPIANPNMILLYESKGKQGLQQSNTET